MFTLFTTPKPFRDHIDTIQRNALKSWTLLHPDVEVILFGDDEGSADVASELGIRHEPHVERNDAGMKRVDYLFSKTQEIARHETLCYVNCDIILMNDFARALARVRKRYARFLMVGRRWDTPINERISFSDDWEAQVRNMALSTHDRRNPWWIDYFAFARGTYADDLLPFVLGTVRWDNWLIWKVLDSGFPVVDASRAVIAVHQNHDYAYHPQGQKGVWEGEAAKRNLALAGGWSHLRNINDATRRLTPSGRIRRTWIQRRSREAWTVIWGAGRGGWVFVLEVTYKLRHTVGLNRKGIARLKALLASRGSQS